jgi:hypothetical protein
MPSRAAPRAALRAHLCCAVLCCAVLCCAVLCCAVLCCAVLCCAVLRRPQIAGPGAPPEQLALQALHAHTLHTRARALDDALRAAAEAAIAEAAAVLPPAPPPPPAAVPAAPLAVAAAGPFAAGALRGRRPGGPGPGRGLKGIAAVRAAAASAKPVLPPPPCLTWCPDVSDGPAVRGRMRLRASRALLTCARVPCALFKHAPRVTPRGPGVSKDNLLINVFCNDFLGGALAHAGPPPPSPTSTSRD